MIGLSEIKELSIELNIHSTEIIEVFRDQIIDFYGVDWITFSLYDTSIFLIKFNLKKNKIEEKRIYIKKENLKKIITNTINLLYKYKEKENLKKLQVKLNLKEIQGVYQKEKNIIELYKNGKIQVNLIGKLNKKYDTEEYQNKFTTYTILGKTLFKKEDKYIVECVPKYKKYRSNKKDEKVS